MEVYVSGNLSDLRKWFGKPESGALMHELEFVIKSDEELDDFKTTGEVSV